MKKQAVKKAMGSHLLSIESIVDRLPATYQPRLFSNDNLCQPDYIHRRLAEIASFLEAKPSDTSEQHMQIFAIEVLKEFQHDENRKQNFSELKQIETIWKKTIAKSDIEIQELISQYQQLSNPESPSL